MAAIIEVIKANVAGAKQIVHQLPQYLPSVSACGCGRAAQHAVLSTRDAISPEARQRLRALYGRDP